MKSLILSLGLLAGFAHAGSVNLTAPDILGVACGGYQGGTYTTIVGFDTNGNVQATVYETMSCAAGGRGGHSTTYKGSSNVTWDFNGGVITSWNAPLAIAAVGTIATDAYGNVVQAGPLGTPSAVLTVNQLPPTLDPVEAVVPTVVGLTVAAAEAAIMAAGLLPLAYADANLTSPPGIVFSQSFAGGPQAGQEAPFGSYISFWYPPAITVCHHHCGD
jgi:hypothetical protein